MTLSIAIMQVATSVAIMQVLKLRYNYSVVLSVRVILVDLSVAIMYRAVSVTILQLCFCSTYACDSFRSEYVSDVTFIVIVQVGVSVAFMQVLFSAEHYAHDCFYIVIMQVPVSGIAM